MQIQGPRDHERPHFPLYHYSLCGSHLGVVGGTADGPQAARTRLAASTHSALTALRVGDLKSVLVAGPEGRGGDSMCGSSSLSALGVTIEASSDVY